MSKNGSLVVECKNSITKTMPPIQKQIQENFKQLEDMKKHLGVRPKMDVLQTNGTTTGKFDLRSLNEKITKRKNVAQ